MEPQLYRCGNVPASSDTRFLPTALQWSRNFIVAEILRSLISVGSGWSLQWSRNFIVAEIMSPAAATTATPTLQWSRNFIVAEMITWASPLDQISMLQWSRNFIVAEMNQAANNHGGPYNASMEPQLYRCGNGTRLRRSCTPTPLQWSRNFIVAEMRVRCACKSLIRLLQWSRNFIVAEIWPSWTPAPRLTSCFNGAATLSLRKCASPTARSRPISCFNGAATLSLRKWV